LFKEGLLKINKFKDKSNKISKSMKLLLLIENKKKFNIFKEFKNNLSYMRLNLFRRMKDSQECKNIKKSKRFENTLSYRQVINQ